MALNFPNSPGIGTVYTDTTSGFSFQWDGTVWRSYSPASSSNIQIIDNISSSFNGSNTTFALTVSGVSLTPANSQQLRIVLGGVVQTPGTDYYVSTSNIVFTDAPAAGLTFSGVSLGPAVPVNYANSGNIYVRNTYTGAGTTGPFDFTQGYTIGYLDVYRNGVRLRSGTDFVGTSGTNFFLTDATATGDEIEAIGYSVASLVQASSNLDNLNVTGIGTIGTLKVTTGVITATSLSVTNANITGILTATSFNATNSNITGIETVTTLNTTTLNGTSGLVSVGTTIRTRGFVETQNTVAIGATILTLDASQGTVFTHTTSAQIGIVSFTGIRTDTAGTQTFTVLVTQGATPRNTTGVTGIGTALASIRISPGNVGYTTHIKVGGGSTITLTNSAGALDLLTFIVSYDGATSIANTSFTVVGFAATDFRNTVV